MQLVLPGVAGRLVRIEEFVEKLDWGAVSAAIDFDPYFARDGPNKHKRANPSNAWHAAKIHNFAREMGTAEACCERVGSIMHHTDESTRFLNDAGALMDTTLLKDAGLHCIGTSRDAQVVREVVSTLEALGYRPLAVSPKIRKARRQAGVPHSVRVASLVAASQAEVQASGRFVGSLKEEEEDDDEADPSLPEWALDAGIARRHDIAGALAERRQQGTLALEIDAVTTAVGEAVKAGLRLPTFYEDPRIAAQDRAGSVCRASLQAWIASEDGAKWLLAKRARLEDPDVARGAGSSSAAASSH